MTENLKKSFRGTEQYLKLKTRKIWAHAQLAKLENNESLVNNQFSRPIPRDGLKIQGVWYVMFIQNLSYHDYVNNECHMGVAIFMFYCIFY